MVEKEHEDGGVVDMTLYELGYHLVPSLGEDDLALRVTEIQKVILAQGGTVISEGQPQAYTLAYPMRKMRGGRWNHYEASFFGWVRFNMPAMGANMLKEFLETDEYLIRYLLVKLDPVALVSVPVQENRAVVEVEVEPKTLTQKQEVEEEKGEVSEEELDKQIEQLIH